MPTPGGATTTARPTWADIFLWNDPVSSVIVFTLGVAFYATARWALNGGTSVTPTSATAYLLLSHLGVNFVRFFCSARWHAASMWEGSAWIDSVAERAVRAVRRAAALHDTYLSTRDPHITLSVSVKSGMGLQLASKCKS